MPVVTIDELTVKQFLREILEVPDRESPKSVSVTEIPVESLPVKPTPEVAMTDLLSLPPVEDEDYVPTSKQALAKAAYALTKDVPAGDVSTIYKKVKKIVSDTECPGENAVMSQGESLHREVMRLVLEASDDDDDLYVPPPPNSKQQFGDMVRGMMGDYEEEDPSTFDFPDDKMSDLRQQMNARSDAKVKNRWADINLRKKKRTPEFWEEPDYKPEPVGKAPGDYGYEAPWEEIAQQPDVEGLNTSSAVKQFIADPRRLNVLDKMQYLITLVPEKERHKVMVQAAADFLDALESGKRALVTDPKDPAIQAAVVSYIRELEDEGVLDAEDAEAMSSRIDFVVDLDSFKKYAIDYFDDNFDVLVRHHPYREWLKKYWDEMLRSDPDLMDDIEKRAQANIDMNKEKKAAKAIASGKPVKSPSVGRVPGRRDL